MKVPTEAFTKVLEDASVEVRQSSFDFWGRVFREALNQGLAEGPAQPLTTQKTFTSAPTPSHYLLVHLLPSGVVRMGGSSLF